jgi:protein tyrosine/serine phosphatase
MSRQLTLALLLLFLALPSRALAQTTPQNPAPPPLQHPYGEKLKINGLRNAGKISDSLYRGAQPNEKGLSELKLLGVTTIVDLRGEGQDKIEWERETAESLGMRFVQISVSGWSPPTDEQLVQFFSLFQGKPRQKVFVHCLFGDDRTGVFVAAYRMTFQDWTPGEAQREMYFFGFNGFWHPRMKSFIRGFPAHLQSAPALAPFRQPPH